MMNEKDSSKVAYIICSILVFFVIGCIDAILIKEWTVVEEIYELEPVMDSKELV